MPFVGYRPRWTVLAVALILLVTTVACSVNIRFGPTPTPTAEPTRPRAALRPTFTPTPAEKSATEGQATDAMAATATPAGQATATPTEAPPTPTPTPAVPLASPNSNMNVRQGPGTVYPVIGAARPGESYEITGKNPAGDWWQIDYKGRPGWLFARLTQTQGNISAVQVAANIPAPPPPTATPIPQPTPVPQPTAPPAPQYEWMLVKDAVRPAPNCGVVHFDGQVQYADGSPQNGVCVHIAFYGPRTTKCSGCGGMGNGNWSFAPFGSGNPQGVTVEIYVVGCPGTIPPDGKTHDPSEAPLTPISDKFVATVTNKCQTGQWTNIIFRKTR